jgi:hypothetical protein
MDIVNLRNLYKKKIFKTINKTKHQIELLKNIKKIDQNGGAKKCEIDEIYERLENILIMQKQKNEEIESLKSEMETLQQNTSNNCNQLCKDKMKEILIAIDTKKEEFNNKTTELNNKTTELNN